ncbi:hypothetical protein QN277_003273 [Acacia crassicarpa]|uniref:Cysteine proteinase n=1 Tax=Acacia crassicarpa TaxID=499986 RepID=A0AAE1IZX7_9FABA|nr:hypothetical protein QN277_003273 [Acacia crassicarpa]
MNPPMTILIITFSFLLFTSSLASRSDKEVMSMYEEWLMKHRKASYSNGGLVEKLKRFEIFKDNLKYIDDHNAQNHTFKLGLNGFADLTNHEYAAIYLGTLSDTKRRVVTAKSASPRYALNDSDKLPSHVDWRLQAALTPIKDQGSCGSCWAFSTVATVEAINKIESGELVSLSEQELVDCDTSHNNGCHGGLMDYAFNFIVKNGGIDTEDDYPYLGIDGKCDPIKKNARVVKIDGYEHVPPFNEDALKKAVTHQPVSVAIEATGRDFQLYHSGVFTGECGANVNHAVVVVGYGNENGLDYWLVRNSWGTVWGEDGYVKIERNVPSTFTGKCGIAMEALYPVKNALNSANPISTHGDNELKISST